LANNGVYHEKHVVQKITANDGTVVYEHETAGVQVYSPAAASIMMELLRGVLSSGLTTSFKAELSRIDGGLASADWVGKTGTSNAYADAWLMLSTPTVTLGSWSGHDDNTSLSKDASSYMARYVANLVSAVHQADPSIFGTDQKFILSDDVIRSTVLTTTGQQAGTAIVNGRQITVSGSTTTSYWAKNGAPVTSYDFMIGGTDSDKQKAWNAAFSSTTTTNGTSNTQTNR
jgi:penicillin-binding protein